MMKRKGDVEIFFFFLFEASTKGKKHANEGVSKL